MSSKIKAPTVWERRIIKIMVLLGLFSILNFLFFFFRPEHPGNAFLYVLLAITILYSAFKKLYMWYNYSNISVPEEPTETPDVKVDILTTYFPGEPYQMIVTTLEAITKITYPHTTYLCDEANDPFLRKFCEENGIHHITRNNRKDAKAGNINNALEKHARGDICVVLDPDHIPEPHFLDPIIPHFSDPKIGFVQIVQSYYNIKDTLVARGAAEQTFQFYGPMMMTLNAYGTVNAIGANCVFRRKALDSIGGHAPGLCEDMHTAMLLYAKGWKAVYLPQVLAKGLAPSNLTTYFKQQLKWARGTFDLLLKVYPKVYKDLTVRQRIHFAVLPLHYLTGIMCFINFLIPILALVYSTTPWEGNFVDFLLVLLPVLFSGLLIRTFVQKWVIEKEERGFHIVGGLLQINTWWIYILGLFYTIVDKQVLYLPTPKQSEFNTNLKIVLPNMLVCVVSIAAIAYGLQRDLTPFSLVMAGFALFNTLIMFCGIYMTVKVTNQNRILRSTLSEKALGTIYQGKRQIYQLFHRAFAFTRLSALPLLMLIILLTLGLKQAKDFRRWNHIVPTYFTPQPGKYLGIFNPSRDDGGVDLEEINSMEAKGNFNFDIISVYTAWTPESVENFPRPLLEEINAKNAIPMITWEPWVSELPASKGIVSLEREQQALEYVARGHFDSYIRRYAQHLADYGRPVFLRFAHEFDNPQYPWSAQGNNSPSDFKQAWRHVYEIMKSEGAHEVIFVWNPWRAETMAAYYPGDAYVDWLGVTSLNYGPLNQDGKTYSFEDLYQPFRGEFGKLTRKPVMISEFGSLNLRSHREQWIQEALASMKEKFPEIAALVLFNSAYDNNIPKNDWYTKDYLDWTVNTTAPLVESFDRKRNYEEPGPSEPKPYAPSQPVTDFPIRGVRYDKGEKWRDNYYVLTRRELQEDFKKMKSSGINTISFPGGNMYDRNILSQARNHGLQVIYEFDLDFLSGFLTQQETKRELQEEILEKVETFKDEETIIAYSFNYALSEIYAPPRLFFRKRLYLDWLEEILWEIKKADPSKSLVLNLSLDERSMQEISSLRKRLPIDSYGLLVRNQDMSHWNAVQHLAKTQNLSVFLSSIGPELLINRPQLMSGPLLLEDWQNDRMSNRISFDGLVDFKGRKKKILSQLETRWNHQEPVPSTPVAVRILRPAQPLFPGRTAIYHAMIHQEGTWINLHEVPEDFTFEWYLVKNDRFGNPLALKSLGSGRSISLEIPQHYKQYELLLKVESPRHEYTLSSRSSLHTPAGNSSYGAKK